MDSGLQENLLTDPCVLRKRIQDAVGDAGLPDTLSDLNPQKLRHDSVVLFVLTDCRHSRRGSEPCLILNKRSAEVRQAGDLCCPGGGLSWKTDRLLASLLSLPGSPLKRWPQWPQWRKHNRQRAQALRVMLAAGLREAWEEMRLKPLGVSFLGMLPPQHLVMFDRVIYPLVVWAPVQRLKANWEVSRIVAIPLRQLLDANHYGRFRPMVTRTDDDQVQPLRLDDFPCFIYQDECGREMLWGATYRITQSFLEKVFGFRPPPMEHLPLARRHLDETYLNGSRWTPRAADRKQRTDW